MRSRRLAALAVAVVAVLAMGVSSASAVTLTAEEELGKMLFFDTNLSDPAGQSCAACHAQVVGYTGPSSAINAAGAVYEGAVAGRFGNRKPPAASYAGASPILAFNEEDGVWEGGMFWDGRATGWTLGDPLAEQAQGPYLNPLEQNLASSAAAVEVVKNSSYAASFTTLYGDIWSDTGLAYEKIARAVAAYERSAEVNPYSSKYDAFLAGKAKLSKAEKRGMRLFFGKAKCSLCHSGIDFTDFTYDNLGVPRNPENPFYAEPAFNPAGYSWVDGGLGEFLMGAGYSEATYTAEWGKQKVPTLRNVDRRVAKTDVKAYGHNGYFKSLKQLVHFYNTRDRKGAGWNGQPWPAPEVAQNVNSAEIGNLRLSARQENDLVAFMKTLSDGYMK